MLSHRSCAIDTWTVHRQPVPAKFQSFHCKRVKLAIFVRAVSAVVLHQHVHVQTLYASGTALPNLHQAAFRYDIHKVPDNKRS
jgi:hypothetical protein